jgi:hypothetical protein
MSSNYCALAWPWGAVERFAEVVRPGLDGGDAVMSGYVQELRGERVCRAATRVPWSRRARTPPLQNRIAVSTRAAVQAKHRSCLTMRHTVHKLERNHYITDYRGCTFC